MDISNSPAELIPKHVRAARALLAWSQQDLAKQAGVAASTIADFERGKRKPVANNAQAIRDAMEKAGVRFLPGGAVIGPSVPPIYAPERHGRPMRWVNVGDLADWANRQDSIASLPILLSHLIHASLGPAVRLDFPSDESVRHPGWDGRTSAERPHIYVPQGKTGWEITSQRSNIAQKADSDYEKRTADPAPLDPATSAYIFVTLRHWPKKKDEWAKSRQFEGSWREVRVYDAADLVHWIEQTPAVGLWLARRLGKRPDGVRELDEYWEEWSLATRLPLTGGLVLSGRDEDAIEVLRWLRGEPSVLSIQATTTGEAVAFFHATIGMLPDEVAAHYRARCLVATNATAARALADAPAPLILVLTEPEPGLAHRLTEHGHFVLQAYDDRAVSHGEVRKLARPSREGIADALTDAGFPEPQAQGLARDSARNLAVLRRLIPAHPGRLPAWAQEPPPRDLLAALLAGGWDEDTEGDKITVSELSGKPYDEVTAGLAGYIGEFDSPLRKIGSTWRVASPLDAWMLLARYLTTADLERFEAVADAVLGSKDPRHDMDPDDRWMSAVKGIAPKYSELLRYGIGEVLILLANRGEKVQAAPDAPRRADAIAGKLLQNADRPRWWSLSRDFTLLAEASPKTFLDAIEDSLDRNDPPIRALFDRDEDGVLGKEYLSDLLWALESLAWSPDLLPRVTLVLARLDAIYDPPEGGYVNCPANSLCQIHRLWLPQTYATLDLRLKALDLVRRQETGAAWKLMLGLLPRTHDTSTPSPMPRWRNFTMDKPEVVTWELIRRGATAISERLLSDAGVNVSRWLMLLERLSDIVPDCEKALAALEDAEPKIKDKVGRTDLWACLRRELHRHRRSANAKWSLPAEQLNRLESIHDRFAPADPLERVAWLFEQGAVLPNPSHEGWQAEERQIEDARRQAVQEMFAAHGLKGILNLAKATSAAGYIGKALFEAGIPEADLDILLETALRSTDTRERDVAHGLIFPVFRERKEPWAGALIAKAGAEDWGDTARLAILRALPEKRWTWDRVAQAGEKIETAYWRITLPLWIDGDAEDIAYAADKLISVGRARRAVHLIGHGKKNLLPSDLLAEVLREAAQQSFECDNDANEPVVFEHNEPAVFEHHVAGILTELDERPDVDKDTLAELEWAYLAFLQYSQRPARVLLEVLSKNPSFFVKVLCLAFKPGEDSGVDDPVPEYPDRAHDIALQAHRLLDLWDRIPGSREDGTIDGQALEAWVKEARSQAKEVGREDIADDRIGAMLSASPIGADGNWPAEAVRDVIDLFRSKPMIEGFQVGKSNRRGVTTRRPRAGGTPEREEAAEYRKWTNAIAYEHPHTAKALDALADSCERKADFHDENAERFDWQH